MSASMYNSGRSKGAHWQSREDLDSLSVADDDASVYSCVNTDGMGVGLPRPSISHRLRTMLKMQQYTDVTFELCYGRKPKPVFKAHKAILAASSSKFAEMLYGENVGTSQKLEIQINNVSEEAFRNIVEYLYTDEVYFSNDDIVMETLVAADKFEITSLVYQCQSYFASADVTAGNACSRLQLATANQIESLKTRCIQYIQDNTASVLQSSDFLKSSSTTVRSICRLQRLSLTCESELFNGAVRWASAQSSGSKRELLEPILKNIRFLSMTASEFRKLYQNHHGIFTDKEVLNILVYLTDSSSRSAGLDLPSWCNKSTSRRCLAGATARGRQVFQYDQKIPISLKSTRYGYVPNLVCTIEVSCKEGRHAMKGVKLSFDDPVTERSVIDDLTITVLMKRNNYSFTERLRVQNSKEIYVTFTRSLLVSPGNVFVIQAEAKGVKDYKFLQFDENSSVYGSKLFDCTLGSTPQGLNSRQFFISEILFGAPPKQNTHPRGRGGYHRPSRN